MKKIEAAFSCLSFTVAIVASIFLGVGMASTAFFIATLGSVVTLVAYVAAINWMVHEAGAAE